jgi:hypothetical protein
MADKRRPSICEVIPQRQTSKTSLPQSWSGSGPESIREPCPGAGRRERGQRQTWMAPPHVNETARELAAENATE